MFKQTKTSPLLDEYGKQSKWNIYIKSYLENRKEEGVLPRTLILDKDNLAGTRDVKELGIPFSFAKPVGLIRFLITVCGTGDNDIIMDFFAGSGTTAQAVMELNSEDGGNRRWILCQIDEPTGEKSEARREGYETIDEIARERIKRAAAKIGDASGFKSYYVREPQAKAIDMIEKFDPSARGLFLPEDMAAEFACPALEASGEDTILTTWLAADGYTFTGKIETVDFLGYKAHYAGNSKLYLIARGWTARHTEELLNRVGTDRMNLNTLIIYGCSFDFESLKELEDNMRQSLDKNIQIEKRY